MFPYACFLKMRNYDCSYNCTHCSYAFTLIKLQSAEKGSEKSELGVS